MGQLVYEGGVKVGQGLEASELADLFQKTALCKKIYMFRCLVAPLCRCIVCSTFICPIFTVGRR